MLKKMGFRTVLSRRDVRREIIGAKIYRNACVEFLAAWLATRGMQTITRQSSKNGNKRSALLFQTSEQNWHQR